MRSRPREAATRSWDYIVVGAGAAGCVVAGRLSQTMPQPARRRGSLELLSRTITARIVIENSRARGVEILKDGLRQKIWAEREIILCGGTVNSPQLLMFSGIGPADHLSRLGIPVVVYAPEVGRNLQNHPSYALRFACSQPVTAYKYLNSRAAPGRAMARSW